MKRDASRLSTGFADDLIWTENDQFTHKAGVMRRYMVALVRAGRQLNIKSKLPRFSLIADAVRTFFRIELISEYLALVTRPLTPEELEAPQEELRLKMLKFLEGNQIQPS